VVLAAEVAGCRRLPSARAFMCFTGLVPAEYSDGERTRRGSITKAGSEPARTALIEAGLVLPVPARDRRHVSPPPRRPWPAPGGRSAGCTPLQGDDCPQQARRRRSHRDGLQASRSFTGRFI